MSARSIRPNRCKYLLLERGGPTWAGVILLMAPAAQVEGHATSHKQAPSRRLQAVQLVLFYANVDIGRQCGREISHRKSIVSAFPPKAAFTALREQSSTRAVAFLRCIYPSRPRISSSDVWVHAHVLWQERRSRLAGLGAIQGAQHQVVVAIFVWCLDPQ
eukprot:6231723-Amphidinium_carterae.1